MPGQESQALAQRLTRPFALQRAQR